MLQGKNGITVWKDPLCDPTFFCTEPIFLKKEKERLFINMKVMSQTNCTITVQQFTCIL